MSSKTAIVLVVFAFFTILSTFIGLYEQSTYYTIQASSDDVNQGALNFLPAIIQGYKDLPVALNLIIFGSIAIMMTWLVIGSLPTMNG